MAEVVFKIPDMFCEGCAETITTSLKKLSGIQEVKPKVFQKHVYVCTLRTQKAKTAGGEGCYRGCRIYYN